MQKKCKSKAIQKERYEDGLSWHKYSNGELHDYIDLVNPEFFFSDYRSEKLFISRELDKEFLDKDV